MKPKSFSQKQEIFKNEILDLYSVIADFGDFSREYFVTKRGMRVGVILEKDGFVLLVKQYRFVINDYSWELPSGGAHKGESLEDAAVRECMEETGMKCKTLTHIYDFILSADVADSPAHIYVCRDFYLASDFDRQEIAEIRWISYQECLKMIFAREIKDVFTIIGLLAYDFKKQ